MDSFRSRFHFSALFEFQPRSLDGNIYRGSLPRPLLVALLLRARQHDDRERQPTVSSLVASSCYLSPRRRASIGTYPSFSSFPLSLSPRSIISLPLSSSLIHFMEFVRLGLFALLITFRSYLSLSLSFSFSLSVYLFRSVFDSSFGRKFHQPNGNDRQFRVLLCRFDSGASEVCNGMRFEIYR